MTMRWKSDEGLTVWSNYGGDELPERAGQWCVVQAWPYWINLGSTNAPL
jgi:hypothetical protein